MFTQDTGAPSGVIGTGERRAVSMAVTKAGGVKAAVPLLTTVEEVEGECHMKTAQSWLLSNQ